MIVKPLRENILIKRVEEENRTAGGIILPDTAKEKPSEGKVIAIGEGRVTPDGKVLPMSIKVGDTVLFSKWTGTEIKVDGEPHLIVKEGDILAIIER
ncbi:MAG: co-chaperone GroES [Alphaproteobacteria bacterium]|nr:co-chaperone GroES [Alphaproteobacteria bacterium]